LPGALSSRGSLPKQIEEVVEHLLSFFDKDPVMLCLGANFNRPYLKTAITDE
jgi:hypothetical protein